ncbi:MAG: hypothetical protein MJZ47_02310 [Bacteroidales bacterium]|nr:hypothetical protein [Bacteroidales bacterium]
MKDRNKLMEIINSLNVNEIFGDEIIRKSIYNNVWFTEKNISGAVDEVKRLTKMENMREIVGLFPDNNHMAREIAVVLSGETPLDNFCDFLCILLSGNGFVGKISHDDPFLLKAYADALAAACPEIEPDINFVNRPLTDFDAIVLNDNGNNSVLKEYFANIPHLFRHVNLGMHLIKGDEKQSDLEELAYRCFVNFGRGRHSVRNIFVPKNYDFQPLLAAFAKWDDVKNNARYFNNYEYRKSICLLGKTECIDNGFVILRQSDEMNPNVSEIFYHEYESLAEMLTFFQKNKTDSDIIGFLQNL